MPLPLNAAAMTSDFRKKNHGGGEDYVYTVLYKEDCGFLKCNCRSFESRGYPHMSSELEKYKELEKMFNEMTDIALILLLFCLYIEEPHKKGKGKIKKKKKESCGRDSSSCNERKRKAAARRPQVEAANLRSISENLLVVDSRGRPRTNCLRSSNESGHRTVRRRVANNSQQQRRTNSRRMNALKQHKSKFK
ncbi:hypothetical protein M9H77_09544 [Catharanthus roseus]|uniref:Uncharacterized protein n=1 Tax=Catharanthus roseus TaxID=4058 RepID=A0ACC0C144_CATRO|nr:hypothetical protein M9H77_09544 [Catharanthus roseus]